jgi:hypothetical protein
VSRYRRIAERLRRPLAAVFFLFGLYALLEAICLGRGGQADMSAGTVLAASVVVWLVPFARRTHPPSESTLQWARRRRG